MSKKDKKVKKEKKEDKKLKKLEKKEKKLEKREKKLAKKLEKKRKRADSSDSELSTSSDLSRDEKGRNDGINQVSRDEKNDNQPAPTFNPHSRENQTVLGSERDFFNTLAKSVGLTRDERRLEEKKRKIEEQIRSEKTAPERELNKAAYEYPGVAHPTAASSIARPNDSDSPTSGPKYTGPAGSINADDPNRAVGMYDHLPTASSIDDIPTELMFGPVPKGVRQRDADNAYALAKGWGKKTLFEDPISRINANSNGGAGKGAHKGGNSFADWVLDDQLGGKNAYVVGKDAYVGGKNAYVVGKDAYHGISWGKYGKDPCRKGKDNYHGKGNYQHYERAHPYFPGKGSYVKDSHGKNEYHAQSQDYNHGKNQGNSLSWWEAIKGGVKSNGKVGSKGKEVGKYGGKKGKKGMGIPKLLQIPHKIQNRMKHGKDFAEKEISHIKLTDEQINELATFSPKKSDEILKHGRRMRKLKLFDTATLADRKDSRNPLGITVKAISELPEDIRELFPKKKASGEDIRDEDSLSESEDLDEDWDYDHGVNVNDMQGDVSDMSDDGGNTKFQESQTKKVKTSPSPMREPTRGPIPPVLNEQAERTDERIDPKFADLAGLDANELQAKALEFMMEGDMETYEQINGMIQKLANQGKQKLVYHYTNKDELYFQDVDSKGRSEKLKRQLREKRANTEGDLIPSSRLTGKLKGVTLDVGKDGKVERFFQNDDKYSLEELVEKEKMNRNEAGRVDEYDANLENFILKKGRNYKAYDMNDDTDDVALHLHEWEGKKNKKSQEQLKKQEEYHRRKDEERANTKKHLQHCHFCKESLKFSYRNRILAESTNVYIAMENPKISMYPGEILIVPKDHLDSPSMNDLQDDVYEEVRKWQQVIVKFFEGEFRGMCKGDPSSGNESVLAGAIEEFLELDAPHNNDPMSLDLETVKDDFLSPLFVEEATDIVSRDISSLGGGKHAHIRVFPIPKKNRFDDLKIFTRECLLTAENEFETQHKPVIEIKGSRGIQGSMPSRFPYFFAEFGVSGGLAHAVERKSNFAESFLKKMLCSALKLDFMTVQGYSNSSEAENIFSECKQSFERYDWTKLEDAKSEGSTN